MSPYAKLKQTKKINKIIPVVSGWIYARVREGGGQLDKTHNTRKLCNNHNQCRVNFRDREMNPHQSRKLSRSRNEPRVNFRDRVTKPLVAASAIVTTILY